MKKKNVFFHTLSPQLFSSMLGSSNCINWSFWVCCFSMTPFKLQYIQYFADLGRHLAVIWVCFVLYMGHMAQGDGGGGHTDCGHLYLQRQCYLQLSPHGNVASVLWWRSPSCCPRWTASRRRWWLGSPAGAGPPAPAWASWPSRKERSCSWKPFPRCDHREERLTRRQEVQQVLMKVTIISQWPASRSRAVEVFRRRRRHQYLGLCTFMW